MKDFLRTIFCITIILTLPSQALAKYSTLPGLEHIASVLRDVDGIAHVYAKSQHDAYFLHGWVHAQDRLFQMDFSRRQASGTLAELVGSKALGSDVEFRTLGLRRAAELSLSKFSPETLEAFEAYAAGVNAYLARHPLLPPEYGALELSEVEPWTPLDSATVGKLLVFSAAISAIDDIERTEALWAYQAAGALSDQRFDATALFFEDIFRSAPFEPVATIPDVASGSTLDIGATKSQKGAARAGKAMPAVRSGTLEIAREYLDRVRALPYFRDALGDAAHSQGSNVWVVSGEHTASGRPLLANDPHRTLSSPSNFYPIHLHSAKKGLDVSGIGVAGIPFVVVGQSRKIAWGATRNPSDVTDVFREKVVPDPGSPSGLSTVYMGTLEPIFPLPQTYYYNEIGDGESDNLALAPPDGQVDGTSIPAAVLIVPRRNMGPIIQIDLVGGEALSVQSTLFSGTLEMQALRGFNLARNLDEFIEAVQFSDAGLQNWFFADRWEIAYFADGEIPLREDLQAGFVDGLPPFFIRKGTGGNEWLPLKEAPSSPQTVPFEIIPFEEMPQAINPPAGYLVNANNDPLGVSFDNNPLNQLRPGGGIFYLNPGYAGGFRAFRITRLLEERLAAGYVSGEDMQAIQADVVMHDAEVFTPYILEAYNNAMTEGADPVLAGLAVDPGVVEAVRRLRGWDHSTPTGIMEGYDASDWDGKLSPPSEDEIAASIATTIYSVWRGQMIRNTIDRALNLGNLPKPGSREAVIGLRNLLDNFDENEGFGASGVNFFIVPGIDDSATRRDIVILDSLADALDLLAGSEFKQVFHGSTDQQDYRWGRLHRLILEHPLGGPFDIPPAGGAFPPSRDGIPGIPVDGGFRVVDASNHPARANGHDEFIFSGSSGPTHRYVGEPGSFRRWPYSQSSLPGGASGVLGDPFYTNLLGQWLTNDTYPMRQTFWSVLRNLFSSEVFIPERRRHGSRGRIR